MKPCLADVNVLLPLLVRHHEHHRLTLRWFESLGADETHLCRIVQLGLVRLLGNQAVMGSYAMPAASAWLMTEQLMQDERVVFAPEPAALDTVMPRFLTDPVPSGKLVGDAYLAAFAVAANLRVATLDQGFRQFPGLDLLLLSS